MKIQKSRTNVFSQKFLRTKSILKNPKVKYHTVFYKDHIKKWHKITHRGIKNDTPTGTKETGEKIPGFFYRSLFNSLIM